MTANGGRTVDPEAEGGDGSEGFDPEEVLMVDDTEEGLPEQEPERTRSERLQAPAKSLTIQLAPEKAPKPRVGKKLNEYDAAKRDAIGTQRRRLSMLSEKDSWYLKRVGPARDEDGDPVQTGLHPDVMTGPVTVQAISNVAGGGNYVVTLDDPSDPAAKWSDIIPIMGKPKRLGAQAGGAVMPGMVPAFAEEEWIDWFDQDAKRWIKVRKTDVERDMANRVPPAVQASIDAANRTAQAALDAVKELGNLLKQQAEPKQDRVAEFLLKQQETERERIKAEKEMKDKELAFLRDKMDAELKRAEADRKAIVEAAKEDRKAQEKKSEDDRKALEAKLEKESERAEKAADKANDLLLKIAENKNNPTESMAAMFGMFRDAKEALAEFGVQVGSAPPRGDGDDEDDDEKPVTLASILKQAGKALPDILDGLKRIAQQGQPAPAVPQLPAPAAAPAAPAAPPPAQDVTPAADGAEDPRASYAALIREIGFGIDGDVPPRQVWDSIRSKRPSVAAELRAYDSVDGLCSDLEGLAVMPGFEVLAEPLRSLAAAAKGPKRKWAEEFIKVVRA